MAINFWLVSPHIWGCSDVPLPNGRFMAYKWWLLASYKSSDDLPSTSCSSMGFPPFLQAQNALSVLTLAGRSDIPVYLGATLLDTKSSGGG